MGGISKHSHTLTHKCYFLMREGEVNRWKVHNAAKLIDRKRKYSQKSMKTINKKRKIPSRKKKLCQIF